MANPQNRKRPHSDGASQDDRPTKRDGESLRGKQHPAKKQRGFHQRGVEYHGPWHYPPEFWDRLSKIPLISEALEELDRRNRTRPVLAPCPPLPPTTITTTTAPSPATVRQLARFARHGGPDLCDLRGYPAPSDHPPVAVMSSSSQSKADKSADPAHVTTTSPTTKSKKSITAYNRGFEQHLADNDIHPYWKSQKPDLEDIKAALAVPRPSLSLSRFPDSEFTTFQQNDGQAKDEDEVNMNVVPTITGTKHIDHPSAINTQFGNLEPLTDGSIAPAQPDIYYGAYPEKLDQPLRDELSRYIVPSTMVDKPMVPNFFVENKGPNGSMAVMNRQARYDGAIGARAMHTLQNYGVDNPVYDGNAYTFTSTYHGGQLKMYAHHVTEPTAPGGRPEYHMTHIKGYSVASDREAFVQGATAFRNARDLAKKHRDKFIEAANSTYRARMIAVQENLTTPEEGFSDPNHADSQSIASPHQLQQSVSTFIQDFKLYN